MSWRRPADPALAKEILRTFRTDFVPSTSALATFTPREWQQTAFWLDASGLALYFLHRIDFMGLAASIDPAIVRSLRLKLDQNSARSDAMFEEWVSLNHVFANAGIAYANLKGFTLSPHSCPDPALRHQIDFDFLVSTKHIDLARRCLEERGYVLAATTARTWEFKACNYASKSQPNQYAVGPSRSVELHLALDGIHPDDCSTDALLSTLATCRSRDFAFPALSSADQLISQALHLFGHLRAEYTRVSWLLEFQRHVLARRNDAPFWAQLQLRSQCIQNAPLALGLASLVTEQVFGSFAPPELSQCNSNSLPLAVRLWAERYGVQSATADFPGTKLYLLLEQQLTTHCPTPRRSTASRLLPIHPPPALFHRSPHETFTGMLRRRSLQYRFTLFRLRFHLVEGLRYLVESTRWQNLVADQRHADSAQATPNEGRRPSALVDGL